MEKHRPQSSGLDQIPEVAVQVLKDRNSSVGFLARFTAHEDYALGAITTQRLAALAGPWLSSSKVKLSLFT